MRVIVKLFTTKSRASDSSLIPESTVREYLESESYKNAIERGLMVGTITHAGRVLKSQPGGELLTGIVGKDDLILLKKTAVSVIEKIFLPDDPSDEWVYAIQRIFDPDEMDKESAENIKQIIGLIKNGVKVTTSAVIVGYWNEDEVCEKLISVKGNDFTLFCRI